jgi:putative acetyltransferase
VTRTRIRPSRPEDGARVVSIWRAAVDATHDFLTPADRIAIEQEVQSFLPSASLLLAVDEADRPLGFMLLTDGHMDALFIDPAAHRAGIGRQLVQFAAERHPRLTTDVNEQNHQALGFYEHLGFRRTGRSETDGQSRPYPLIHLRLQPSA